MAVNFKHYRPGTGAYSVRYEFDDAGDAIPEHSHGEGLAHNVVVLRGRVAINNVQHDAGSIVDFDWAEPHTIRALAPGTVTLHQFINGWPEGYDRLTEAELSGVLP